MKSALRFSLFGTMLVLSATSATAAESTDLDGTYTLPTSPELREYSSFHLERATWRDDGQNVIFTYVFPEDLTGVPDYSMTMIGKAADLNNEFFELVCFRTGSTATCSRDQNGKACVVRFQKLGLDSDRIKNFLETKYGASPATELRKTAAFTLLGNAIGVLSVTPRP